MGELIFVDKPLLWKDQESELPAYFEFWIPKGAFGCFKCLKEIQDGEQIYLFDNTGFFTKIKGMAKDIFKIRSKHLVLFNVQLWCSKCFLDSSQELETFHKVVARLRK